MEKHFQKNDRLKQVFPFALALLLMAIILLFFPRAFSENDDVGMVYLLENGWHPPFFSSILGEQFIRLYQLQPDIAWYAWYHYLMLWICLGLTFRLLWIKTAGKWLFWVLAIAFGLVFLNLSTQITFSYTSLLLCGLAIISLLNELQTAPVSRGKIFFYGVLLALGWASRFEGASGALLFLLPAIGWTLWQTKPALKTVVRVLPMFVLPLLLTISAERFFPQTTPTEQTHAQFFQARRQQRQLETSPVDPYRAGDAAALSVCG